MFLKLPWPPSVNHYWLAARNGRRYISKEGIVFRNKVALEIKKGPFKTYNEDVGMTLLLYPPDRRKRDIDNILKALFDALQYGGLVTDDAWISRLQINLEGGRKNPQVRKNGQIVLWISPRKLE